MMIILLSYFQRMLLICIRLININKYILYRVWGSNSFIFPYERKTFSTKPRHYSVLLIGLEPIRTFVQGILSPSRAANFATEAFRADGGTRTPDVCVPTYKVGAVATVPHQHFWGPDWIRTSVTDFAELYLSYFYTTRPRDHLLLDWSVTIRLSSRYQRDAFPIKLQGFFSTGGGTRTHTSYRH